jgi:hypothetical protein
MKFSAAPSARVKFSAALRAGEANASFTAAAEN